MPDMTIREHMRDRLRAEADPEYREFHSRLLPGTAGILGVRTPVLRALSKELLKGDWKGYISQVQAAWKADGQGDDGVYYDELILWGLCICRGFKKWEDAVPYITGFIPAINNWAVCDIFCGSLKMAGRYRQEAWEFIQPYLESGQEYGIRFGVVMMLSHFVDEDHVKEALERMDAVRHEGYYVKMAVAWALSIYFIKLPEAVMPYLEQNHLDDWTYNKALQKITESFRVDQETKAVIRSMKRPLRQA